MRDIFASFDAYRLKYNPLGADTVIDTTFLFNWPQVGKDLVTFLEGALYNPNATEEQAYRNAVKNSNTPEEIVSWKPWCDQIVDLQNMLMVTVDPPGTTDPSAGAGDPPSTTGATGSTGGTAPTRTLPPPASEEDAALDQAADSVKRRLSHYCIEPPSVTALAELLKHPLAAVKRTGDNMGNVVFLIDCNSFGSVDARAEVRQCPIPDKQWATWLKGVLLARAGDQEPPQLLFGDVFICIDGGRSRKRLFQKPLVCTKTGADKGRTLVRALTLYISEASYRGRRKKIQGVVKLTQGVYVAASRATFQATEHTQYQHHGGPTRADTFGPVELEPREHLPMLTSVDKKLYFGKRLVKAGGPLTEVDESDEPGDEDDDEAEVVADGEAPLAWHFLPAKVISDLVLAYGGKHVIDLTPSPMHVGKELLSKARYSAPSLGFAPPPSLGFTPGGADAKTN